MKSRKNETGRQYVRRNGSNIQDSKRKRKKNEVGTFLIGVPNYE